MSDEAAPTSSKEATKPLPELPLSKPTTVWRDPPPRTKKRSKSIGNVQDQLSLPPNYQRHLRALVAQAATQVSVAPQAGAAASHLVAWDDSRKEKWVEAVWKAATGEETTGKGLLDQPITEWLPGVQRRRDAYKAKAKAIPTPTPAPSPSLSQTQKLKLSAMTPSDRPSTPAPGSGANSVKRPSSPIDGAAEALSGGSEAFKERLRHLSGYVPYETRRWGTAEWVQVDDDFAEAKAYRPTIPGAFPHTDVYTYESSSPPPASSHTRDPSDGAALTPIKPLSLKTDAVKVVYCMHIPAPPAFSQQSHTRSNSMHNHPSRAASSSSTATIGRRSSELVGSWNRWGSTKTLASANSSSTLFGGGGPHANMSLPDIVKVEFWPGRFALGLPFAEAVESDDEEASEDGMTSSMWSGTRSASRSQPQALSEIIAGAEDDLPPGDDTSLVGGTFVIRGTPADEDYRRKEVIAVEKMLQILIYSLNAMRLELALLDAYGVPREVAPPPPPVKDTSPALPAATTPSNALAATTSKKGAKSFLTKLSNDSKAVWGGWLRRKDSSKGRAEDALSRVKTHETQAPVGSDTARQVSNALPSKPGEDQDHTAAAESVALSSYERHIQTLHKLQNLKLSTTPGLVFPMPPLLLRIAAEDLQRYQSSQSATPVGSQGPATLLHKPRASGHRLGGDIKAGLNAIWPHSEMYEGWVRLQGIDFLHSTIRRIRKDSDGVNELEDQGDLCLQPHNVSFRYFDPEKDETLGQKLDKLFNPTSEDVCPVPSCAGLPLEHEQSWTHAGVCVTLQTKEAPLDPLSEQLEDAVEDEVWVECEECGASSEVRPVKETARLFSWGRYLELLVYHHELLGPADMCPHKQAARSWHFRRLSTILKLSRASVHVLETRMPKLQVGPNVAKRKPGVSAAVQSVDALLPPEEAVILVEETRREIEAFYVSLERVVASLSQKEASGSDYNTPGTDSPSLGDVVATCRKEESTLYDFLDSCHVGQINNARRRFLRRGRAARIRLKQLQAHQQLDLPDNWLSLEEPAYFTDKALHVLPGSFVLVRDDDPSSVIAYTLSSVEYHEELTRSGAQNGPFKRQDDHQAASIAPSVTPPNDKDVSDQASAVSQLSEGESDNSDDYNADSWTSEVRRKDTPRDLSLLSIRSLAKKKSDGALSLAPGLKTPLAPKPQAPSLELSLEQVEGKAQTSDRLGDLVRTINKATARDPGPPSAQLVEPPSMSRSSSATDIDDASVISVGTVDSLRLSSANVRRARNSTYDSERSVKSTPMAPPSAFKKGRQIEPVLPASPPGSPSRSPGSEGSKDGWSSSMTSTFSNSFSQLLTMGSSVGDSLVGSFKLRNTSGERTSLSSLMGPLSKLSAMDTSLSTFDDKPHISFSYTVGSRLKMTCTVFYATAFDSLRRRCAIDRSFVTSLARTSNWEAQGGKSKACFFKTSDDRYIVKELVSKWGASDTHALLEIAPSYFDHLANSHNRATSLAKIVGFYSVKIQDSSGSASGSKRTLDLLVMENLFHQQKVTRTFDLKGIEGRKVPVKAGPDDGIAPATLFDGEWLEGQRKSPILLQPHSKRILREAIANDAAFLANQSIMDYSLLLGLDEIRGELVTGIVDAIGSYNLLKTLESRGKLALNRGGDVTIIPPDQYRERFETALKQYFIVCYCDLSCPDKWSRSPPAVGKRPLTARDVLPSVV